jgi:hypothetical protein
VEVEEEPGDLGTSKTLVRSKWAQFGIVITVTPQSVLRKYDLEGKRAVVHYIFDLKDMYRRR